MDHGNVNEVVGYIKEFKSTVSDCEGCEDGVQTGATDQIPSEMQLLHLALLIEQKVTKSVGAF